MSWCSAQKAQQIFRKSNQSSPFLGSGAKSPVEGVLAVAGSVARSSDVMTAEEEWGSVAQIRLVPGQRPRDERTCLLATETGTKDDVRRVSGVAGFLMGKATGMFVVVDF